MAPTPWATAADVPAGVAAPPAPTTWDQWLEAAREVLDRLTGGQFPGVHVSRVVILGVGAPPPPTLTPGWVPLPATAPTVMAGTDPLGWGWRGRELVVAALPASPVHSCAVYLGQGEQAELLDPARWRCTRSGLLSRTDERAWPTDGSLAVSFQWGRTAGEGGTRACVALAVELARASPGSPTASAIRNAVTITREGVTVAVNLREYLTGGLTGLPTVDMWITSVNPSHLREAAGVFSPDLGAAVPAPPT